MTPGLFVSTFFIVRFWDDGGHKDRVASVVKRNECQIRRRCVDDFAGARILDPDLHTDFHRRPEDPVHAGPQDQHLADMNRVQKAEVVDCDGRDEPTGVPLGRQSAAQVHEVHHVAAQHISNQVRIIRQRRVRVLGTGLPNRATVEGLRSRFDCAIAHDLSTW
jgi:hypothetical protein